MRTGKAETRPGGIIRLSGITPRGNYIASEDKDGVITLRPVAGTRLPLVPVPGISADLIELPEE
jgi:hypothetical protein